MNFFHYYCLLVVNPARALYVSRSHSSSGCLLRRIFSCFVVFLLDSVMIPAKDFIVEEVKVFSDSEPLSTYLTRETLDMVSIFPGSHYKFKRGYWLAASGANTRNPKQSKERKNKIVSALGNCLYSLDHVCSHPKEPDDLSVLSISIGDKEFCNPPLPSVGFYHHVLSPVFFIMVPQKFSSTRAETKVSCPRTQRNDPGHKWGPQVC